MSIIKNPAATERSYYIVVQDPDTLWSWQLMLRGNAIAKSAESYPSREVALTFARLTRKYAGTAEIDAVLA